jgi:uncharacterized protein YndB with AHSA1/START domain
MLHYVVGGSHMIRRQVVVPVSPERLWEALTEPDQVAGWFGGRVEWDLREGGSAAFRGDDGHERQGRIERLRPGRHLRFVWWPAAPGRTDANSDESRDDLASEVSYLLEPLEEGTRLTIQERQVRAAAPGAAEASGAAERPPADVPLTWTPWDRRLLGAWAGLCGPARESARL